MLKIGLTGNIGSGKTFVSGVFISLGIPVFHADDEARKLFSDNNIKEKIRNLFGNEAFTENNAINRGHLANIVFNDKNSLEKLNGIIHPAVLQKYDNWCKLHEKVVYTIYEAAILFESGHSKGMDKIICVVAPQEIRISRVRQRDDLNLQDIERRMRNQWEEGRKATLSDFVITNDGIQDVREQVIKIHEAIMQLTVDS
jgi:dephospho-CoA kinase